MGTINKLEQAPIKIALLGMDERSVARMATIFKVVFKNRCAVAPEEKASLAIVDLDGDAEAWRSFQQQFPDMPAIVMSASASSVEGAIYISKPAKLDLLWKSISRLVAGLSSSDAIAKDAEIPEDVSTPEKNDNTASAINITDVSPDTDPQVALPENMPEETTNNFQPDNYLLGRILATLKESVGRQCSIHVQCWEDRQLILLPDQRQVFTDLTDSQLLDLSIATANREHGVEITSICGTGTDETNSLWVRAFSRLLGKGELPAVETDGLQSMPLDYFLWDLALRTARGRVPEGTDLNKPLYLQCWPNFPRLPNMPNGMRIAALWVGEPRTLDDIATSLGIDVAEVYSFYSAVFAVGLAGPANRHVDELVAPRAVNKGGLQRDFADAILRHFGNNGQGVGA